MRAWIPPFRAEIETWGTTFGDVVFGPGESILVSDRFRALWEPSDLIGLTGFDPVEIVRVRMRGERIRGDAPRYFHALPVHAAVALDHARSGVRWQRAPTCPACRQGVSDGYDRLVLEGEPRENVFVPRGLGVLLADDRFARFCFENQISNCQLTPAEQASA
jgi:hypothetical protein